MQGHSETLCSLVTITESLRWESQVKGQEKITALWGEKDGLENLTVTFKTTSEMVSDQGISFVLSTHFLHNKISYVKSNVEDRLSIKETGLSEIQVL